jgi:hypothetical protein
MSFTRRGIHLMEDEIGVAEELRRMVEQIERSLSPTEITTEDVVAKARQLQARRKAVLATCVVAAAAVAVTVGLLVGGTPTVHRAETKLKEVPVLDIAPSINMDVITTKGPVSVNFASGDVTHSGAQVTPVVGSSGISWGYQRKGYLVGMQYDGGRYVSVSTDLQTILHTWTGTYGQYGAPASNPADIWISDPYGTPSQATEVNGREVAVGPSVGIPRGDIVEAQLGSNLVIENNGSDNGGNQFLALWNPTTQQTVADYGAFDEFASSATQFAWTVGNTVHIVNADGAAGPTSSGPAGTWARSAVFSPDASKLAVGWSPLPGSTQATSTGQLDAEREVMILNTSSGALSAVPDSSGVSGPVAWTPDGSRIFFGQVSRRGNTTSIATYLLGSNASQRLKIPGVEVTLDTTSVSELFVWSK